MVDEAALEGAQEGRSAAPEPPSASSDPLWLRLLALVVAPPLIVGLLIATMLSLQRCSIQFDSDGPSTPAGARSQRLDVQVLPTERLVDGATVQVRSRAFEPDSAVAVVQCLREADTMRRGVEACDEVHATRFAVPSNGALDVPVTVTGVITVGPTAYDCGIAAGRCLLVVAQLADFDRSGGVPLTFEPDPAAADLTPRTSRPSSAFLPASGTPLDGLVHGDRVTVAASGFVPGEPLVLAWCSDELATSPVEQVCEPKDWGDALAAVMGTLPERSSTADGSGSITLPMTVVDQIEPIGNAFDADAPKPPAVQCDERPGRCSLVIAAAADFHRSAALPYSVAG